MKQQEAALELFIKGVVALSNITPAIGAGRMLGVGASRQLEAALLEDLLAYRAASGLASAWPEERKSLQRKATQQVEREVANKLKRGQDLWSQIHKRALSYSGSAEVEMAFLTKEVPVKIPGCVQCRNDYEAYLLSHPPKLDDADSYFSWTVELHNHVNRKLGKAVFSVEAAKKIHGGA